MSDSASAIVDSRRAEDSGTRAEGSAEVQVAAAVAASTKTGMATMYVHSTTKQGGRCSPKRVGGLSFFRATETSAFLTNAKLRFASVVLDAVLGPPHPGCHT